MVAAGAVRAQGNDRTVGVAARDLLFWVSLAIALAVALAPTYAANWWMIGRGRGHAVVHAHH
jgi:hypothetical protein